MAMQRLKSVRERLQQGQAHPVQLSQVEDGFGMTRQRQKPLCESMGIGNRRTRQQQRTALLPPEAEAQPFASSQEPRRKRGYLDGLKEAAAAQKRGKREPPSPA